MFRISNKIEFQNNFKNLLWIQKILSNLKKKLHKNVRKFGKNVRAFEK